MSDPRCATCGHPRSNHPYRHMFAGPSLEDEVKALEAKLTKAEAGLREIAAEASVPVHTWKNGINFKKMYEGWRKIAVERIDIARAAIAEIKGGNHE